MKTLLSICLAAILLSGCAHNNKNAPAPSVAGVKSSVQSASGSVSAANEASKRSSEHIKAFKNNAERIDYKATRALELL